jgi:hypothetical protein
MTIKKIWEALKDKNTAQQTPAERVMAATLLKKGEEQSKCELDLKEELAIRAWADSKTGTK